MSNALISNAAMPSQATTNGTDFSANPESSVPGDSIIDAATMPSANNPTVTLTSSPDLSPNDPHPELTSDSWRVEVAARLERYRTRRKPRSPRYPSLLLPFDAPESWSRSTPAPRDPVDTASTSPTHGNLARHLESYSQGANPSPAAELKPCPAPDGNVAEPSPAPPHELSSQPGNVIEFPRSAAIPVSHASDLADPVFDHFRPRIVEAPEILPPPPALGGMLIEPSAQELANKQTRATTTFPSTSASITQRTVAALIDGIILAASISAFAAIFLRLNPSLRPDLHPSLTTLRASLPLLIGAAGSIAALFWAAYQFFFIVYTGSTPGLRAARLRLAAFDGSPLNRSARRWRVFASFLSALSAGLGYLWCLLDQHGLCWHDRITRTHIQTAKPENAP
jgi:uncharacterized RDD family membrane protein YckC